MWNTEQPAKHKPKELFSKYSETGKRTRRHHQKSKNGCCYCRRRRIKCDEEKPSCSNCVRKQQPCDYSPYVSGSHPSSVKAPTIRKSTIQSQFNLAYLEKALAAQDGIDYDLDDFLPVARLHAQESLAHFAQCDLSWLKSSKVQRILQKDAVSTVTDRPYVLHSVLALSAAHLAYLKPEEPSYQLAAMVHWQHSLRSYSRNFPTDIKSKNSPAVYFANMIQAMLAFAYSRLPLPGESDQRPNWVVTMQGKKIILDMPHVVRQLSQTLWEPLVQAHNNWQQRSNMKVATAREKVPSPTIQALLDYNNASLTPQIDVYEERIYFLAMLEQVPPITEAIGAFVSFVAEAPATFITMVKCGDSFALLLLFHWTQIFATLEQWWIARPAAIERERLYGYLSQSSENGIRELLDFLVRSYVPRETPIKACEP